MYDRLCDKLDTIIEDMARKEKLTASDLQLLDWATHIKKSMMATEEHDGYSHRRRDSMGRYARDEYSRTYNRDGRSDYIDHLHSLMETAPDDKTRQTIQRMIRDMD